MQKTHHAEKRMQQRGFNQEMIEMIMNCGCQENLPGGAIGIFLGDKEYRNIMELADKAKRGKLVIKDGHIQTCYKRHRVNL